MYQDQSHVPQMSVVDRYTHKMTYIEVEKHILMLENLDDIVCNIPDVNHIPPCQLKPDIKSWKFS